MVHRIDRSGVALGRNLLGGGGSDCRFGLGGDREPRCVESDWRWRGWRLSVEAVKIGELLKKYWDDSSMIALLIQDIMSFKTKQAEIIY